MQFDKVCNESLIGDPENMEIPDFKEILNTSMPQGRNSNETLRIDRFKAAGM